MPDSTLVLQLESPVTARPETWRLPLVIAIISCASLLLELALTRLFSVVLFYHFAFLAISVALLGLGAGGVFAHIFRHRLSRWTVDQLGGVLLSANALVILGMLEVVLHSAVSLNLELRNFEKLSLLYIAAAIPFFITGLLFSIVFARESEQVALSSLNAIKTLAGMSGGQPPKAADVTSRTTNAIPSRRKSTILRY